MAATRGLVSLRCELAAQLSGEEDLEGRIRRESLFPVGRKWYLVRKNSVRYGETE
jgi:hypothetical protein